MSEEIRVPPFGAERIVLARWYVPDGGTVAGDDPICELETNKATLDLPATRPGRIRHVAAAGAELRVGDVIAIVTAEP